MYEFFTDHGGQIFAVLFATLFWWQFDLCFNLKNLDRQDWRWNVYRLVNGVYGAVVAIIWLPR